MVLKKKIKLYMIILCILALPISTNAMKKNKIDKIEININEIENRNFEKTISDIKNEINEIEKYSENINMYYFFPEKINELEIHKKNLLNLKEETKNKENINIIENILIDIEKLMDILAIKHMNVLIKEIERKNFNNMTIYELLNKVENLTFHKQNLLNLKNKTNITETTNTVNNMLNNIDKLIINILNPRLNNFENNLTLMDMDDLIDKRKILFNLKNITTNEKAINIINDMLNHIDIKINKFFKLKINNLENFLNQFETDYLYMYKQNLIYFKNITDNEETIDNINILLDNIEKLNYEFIEKIQIEINEMKEKNIENIDINDIKNHIDKLSNYKKELLNLKKELKDEKTLTTIDDMLNNINKLNYEFIEKIQKQNNTQKNINFTIPNFNKNLNIKKSKSATNINSKFKINK